MQTRLRITFSFTNAKQPLTHEFLIEQDYTEEDVINLVKSEISGILNIDGDPLEIDTIDKIVDLEPDEVRMSRYY